MAMITFSENHERTLISFDAGQPLSDVQAPREQGLKWVYTLGVIPSSHVVVVGLGSGFHVAALVDVDPQLKITVVESREALIPVFLAQFPELRDKINIVVIQEPQDIFKSSLFQEVLNDRPYILSFHECWGQERDSFSQVFAHLTGRSASSVQYHFDDIGVNIKAMYLQGNKLLSIKDVLPAVEAATMRENQKQIFRVLGELVK